MYKSQSKIEENIILITSLEEKLLKACKGTSVKNIIYSSSAGVYGNSKSPVKEIVN